MCFVLGQLASDPSPGLVLVSNRDEFYGRQGDPPERQSNGTLSFVAPTDPREGGTWFGFNEDGLLAALTNRLDALPLEDAPSRGWLVRDILSEASNRHEARETYRSMKPEQYNPHRILFLDASGYSVFRGTPDGVDETVGSSELFYLDNQSGLVTESTRIARELPTATEPLKNYDRNELEGFAAGHESFFERDSACLHLEDVAGTLSSSLLRIDPASGTVQYRFAQGQPCENSFEDVTLDDSFRRSILTNWESTSNDR